MRKLVFISGALSISMFGIGFSVKMLHLVGSNLILFFATMLFSVLFIPSAAVYYYHKGK